MDHVGSRQIQMDPGSIRILKISEFLPSVRLKDFQFAIRNSSQNIFLPYRIAPSLLNQLKVSMNVGTFVDPRKIVFGFRLVNF